MTAENITDDQIRALHNSYLDGTATDAIGRHLCHVALGECCINDGPRHRYPTPDERRSAKARLASAWAAQHGVAA